MALRLRRETLAFGFAGFRGKTALRMLPPRPRIISRCCTLLTMLPAFYYLSSQLCLFT
jgi:hypothetical protein